MARKGFVGKCLVGAVLWGPECMGGEKAGTGHVEQLQGMRNPHSHKQLGESALPVAAAHEIFRFLDSVHPFLSLSATYFTPPLDHSRMDSLFSPLSGGKPDRPTPTSSPTPASSSLGTVGGGI